MENLKKALELCENVKSPEQDNSKIIEDSLKYLSKTYTLNDKQSLVLSGILKRSLKNSVSEKVNIEKADMLLLEAYCLKAKLSLDKELINFSENKIDLDYLIKTLKSAIRKNETAAKSENFKAALERLRLNDRGVNAESLSAESGVSVEDAMKYLKKLDVLSNARKTNSKFNRNVES